MTTQLGPHYSRERVQNIIFELFDAEKMENVSLLLV